MASLDDFKVKRNISLDDFQVQGPLTLVSNEGSNVNLAAYTAALSNDPNSVEATYLRTVDQLNREGKSELVGEVVDSARRQTAPHEKQAFASLLADPDLPDEEKQKIADAYLEDRSSLYDIRNIVSTEALISDSEGETEESSEARVNFAAALNTVNEYNAVKQALLNKEREMGNKDFVNKLVDFVEIAMPFNEGLAAGDMLSRMRGGDQSAVLQGLAWMAGAKGNIREAFKAMPINKRREALQAMAEVARSSSSSIFFPGTNEFMRAELLQTALDEGHYGTGEALVDTLVSFLDLMGVGAALREGSRAVRSTKAIPETVEEVPFGASAPDDELRAAEDAVEAQVADRVLRSQEDASEARIRARQAEVEADPVRRAEDAAERRAESRAAVRGEGREALSELEAASESRIQARRTGGDAARMTDEELRSAEDMTEILANKARVESVRSGTQPASLSRTYQNTNPGKARALHQMVAADRTGVSAKAGYGSTRTEAVANDVLPEAASIDGSVRNKVSLPDPIKEGPSKANPRVMDEVNRNGAIYLTPEQKTSVANRVINDFNNAVGVVTRTEMTVPAAHEIGGRFKVGVTYGPRDSGWSSAEDGIERVKVGLRRYGVKDEDITLLRRSGDEYVPAKLEEVGEGGDYLVRVDYDYPIAAKDITKMEGWTDIDVRNNFLDGMPHVLSKLHLGSAQRHFIDPASMFDKHIAGGAGVAVLKSGRLEKVLSELATDFTEVYNKLSRPMQDMLEAEIKRANLEGRNATDTHLLAQGWDEEGVRALKLWREGWDTAYWVENSILIKDLRNKGFSLLEDPIGDTRLFVKELPRNQAGSHRRAYDPESGRMVNLEASDLTKLYEDGGSVARLRQKEFLVSPDEPVELVIVKNQPGGPFAREIRESDQVLNYREGYYTVTYDAPKFVERVTYDKIIRDAEGNIVKKGREVDRRAIATARDTASANRMIKRMGREADDNVEFIRRDSRERQQFGSEETWSLNSSQGRLAQRARGQRLEDANSPITDEMHNHILGPVDSLIRSVRSMSARAGMSDYMEAVKERSIAKFGHMFPKDDFGNPVFPGNSGPENIKAAEAFGDEAAAARSVVEYINSLERGYYNAIDDGFKFFFRRMADWAGKKELSVFERASNFAAEVAQPTRLGKSTAFTLYLALNPLRQLVVQGHQATQLLALSPKYAAGQLSGDMAAIIVRKAEGKYRGIEKWAESSSSDYIDEAYEGLERSGTLAIIDKSNLIRGTLQEVADATSMGGFRRSTGQRAIGLAAQGIAGARKAGFDAGESINKMSSWLTHFHMKKQEVGGRKLTETELDEVTALSENWTYNMNRSGEFAYNENHWGLIGHFMQVPHKAFTTMTLNRQISKTQKAKLAAFNLLMYGGPPGTLISSMYAPFLPEDGEVRQALLNGLESYAFNKLASLMYGEDILIDYSSLSSTDGTGLLEFVSTLATLSPGKVLAESPSGSLFFGYNPRVTNAFKKVAEVFHFKEPDDGGDPASVGEALTEAASMASGMSNAFKARLIWKTGKIHNSSGDVVASDVPNIYAMAKVLGLGSQEEALSRYVKTELYEGSEDWRNDLRERHRLFKRDIFREGITPEEQDYYIRAMNWINSEFTTPAAQDEMLKLFNQDVENGDDTIQRGILNYMDRQGFTDPRSVRDLINNAPLDDEAKQGLHKAMDDISKMGSIEE